MMMMMNKLLSKFYHSRETLVQLEVVATGEN